MPTFNADKIIAELKVESKQTELDLSRYTLPDEKTPIPTKPLTTLTGHEEYVRALAVLADGRFLSGSADKTIKLWDAQGNCLKTLTTGHEHGISALAVLADGRFLSGSADKTIKLWNSQGSCLKTLIEHGDHIFALAVLPDGRFLSGARDSIIKLWDAQGSWLKTFMDPESPVWALAALPDGRFLSSDYKSIKRWDVQGSCLATLTGHTDTVYALAVLPDGRFLSGSKDKSIKLWNSQGSCLATLTGHKGSVLSLAVLPDGRFISGSGDNTIKLWDVKGQCLATLTGHTDIVCALAVLPDGRFISGSDDKTIKLWSSQPIPQPLCFQDIAPVLAALASQRQIQKLNLQKVKLDDKDVPALLKALQSASSLKQIDIRETAISATGAKTLRQGLADKEILHPAMSEILKAEQVEAEKQLREKQEHEKRIQEMRLREQQREKETREKQAQEAQEKKFVAEREEAEKQQREKAERDRQKLQQQRAAQQKKEAEADAAAARKQQREKIERERQEKESLEQKLAAQRKAEEAARAAEKAKLKATADVLNLSHYFVQETEKQLREKAAEKEKLVAVFANPLQKSITALQEEKILELDLSKEKIFDEKVPGYLRCLALKDLVAFFKVLQTNRLLKKLNLQDCVLGDEAIMTLTAVLNDNTILAELNLTQTGITKQGIEELQLKLKARKGFLKLHHESSLVALTLGSTPVEEKTPEVKQEVLSAKNVKSINLTVEEKHSLKTDKSLKIAVSYVIKFDELKLAEKLGQGSFGVVYQATWRFQNVAVKQLLNQKPSSEVLEEFTNEAQMMARLRASNIVQFYGYCESPNYCLVMEYMPKGSLYNVLHDNKQNLDWLIRYQLVNDIACGLAFLHAENILHRDIKSLNVLLDDQYHAKLTDFGLSRLKKETKTSTKGSVGTIQWMAPELFKRGGKYNQKSDVYSLGITFWEIASSRIPFDDAESTDVIPNWVKDGERPGEVKEDDTDLKLKDCPKKIASLIRFCWQGNPDKRPEAANIVKYLKSQSEDFAAFDPQVSNSNAMPTSIQNDSSSAPQYRSNLVSEPAAPLLRK